MKVKLTKDEYEKLDAGMKAEYTADGDDFNLKLEDQDGSDMGSMSRAKDHEKKRRHDAEKKVKDLEAANTTLEDKVHELETSGGDIAKDKAELAKKYDEKLARETAKLQGEVDKRDSHIQKLFVDGVASEMAGRISTVPAAMNRLIKDRLSVEWDGDEIKTVVLGSDGKPSILTVVELEKEIVSNKEYSGIIKGSQASGSGAGSGDGGQSGAFSLADYQSDDKTVSWGKVAEAAKSDPTVVAKVKEAIGQQ